MNQALFRRVFGERVNMVLSSATPRAELAHAMRQLITTVGLVQLSAVLCVARAALPDALAAVASRLAYGHAQLLAVHAAEVTARAIALAVSVADLEVARNNVLRQTLPLGPCVVDPRQELTSRLRALEGPEGAESDPESDVRGLCAGIAHLAARIGLHGISAGVSTDSPGPSQVSADIPRVPSTLPAPPAEEEGDADAS